MRRTIVAIGTLVAITIFLQQILAASYAQPSQGLYQNATTKKVIGIDRLASLSGMDPAQVENATDGSVLFSEINWNANGSSIIFEARGLSNQASLWIGAADGNEFRKINFPFEQFSDVFGYKVSKDDKILFAAIPKGESGQGEGPSNLYSVDLRNNKREKITNYTGSTFVDSFDWMPSDNVVYQTRSFGGSDNQDQHRSSIWLARADGTIIRQLLNASEHFGFQDASTDGKLVGIYENQVAVLDPDIQKITTVTRTMDGNFTIDSYPKFSEDGKYIVYWGLQTAGPNNAAGARDIGRQSGNLTLRIASLDGAIDEAVYSKNGFPQGGQISPVGISSDGRYIAYEVSFQKQTSYDNDFGAAGIYLVDLQTNRIPEFPVGSLLTGGAAQSLLIVLAISFGVVIGSSRLRRRI